MKQNVHGKVYSVLLGDLTGTFITRLVTQTEVDFSGFIGDHHSGLTLLSGGRTPHYPRGTEIRNYRQVSIISLEEIETTRIALDLPFLIPEWYGANLVLQGIQSLTIIPPSTRLIFASGAALVVDGVNSPCDSIVRIVQSKFPEKQGLQKEFIRQAKLRRGIVAWVERPGFITVGDDVEAIIPNEYPYPGAAKD